MFNDAFAEFKGAIKGIQGYWSDGDNLAQFNKALKEGLNSKEAAFSTRTGQWAKSKGVIKVEFGKNLTDANGVIHQEVTFKRPD